MVRFAVVHGGERAASIGRVARRITDASVTVIVDPDEARGRAMASQYPDCQWAPTVAACHERLDTRFDAWIAKTHRGWLLARHDNRPLALADDRWHENPQGWSWGNETRFLPSVEAVREALVTKKLGEPGLVRIHHWRHDPNGDARDLAFCQLDVAASLMSQPPTAFAASTTSGWNESRYHQIHVGFADDRMALIDVLAAPTNIDEYYALSVIGSTGAAYADDHRNMQLVYREGSPRAVRTEQGDLALLTLWRDFVDSLAQHRAPRCGEPEWQVARRWLQASHEALTRRASVTFQSA